VNSIGQRVLMSVLSTSARISRPAARRTLLGVSARRARQPGPGWLEAPAVVFAPHPDDETLGCGGAIARKRKAGADVAVVYFSDGAEARGTEVPPEEFGPLRRRQAFAACSALGVEQAAIQFLDLPYGQVAAHHPRAVERVSAVLATRRPAQAFVSYRSDGHPDHEAAFAIVSEAVRRCGTAVEVLEFPVWLWHHWPWVGLHVAGGNNPGSSAAPRAAGGARGAFDGARTTRLGWRLASEFRLSVPLDGAALDQKRAALACHASELYPLSPGGWSLSTASGGDFLPWMLRPVEVFRSTPHRAQRRDGHT
jgi:LmbE family N-acetylglucosaminyl deacetylase